MSAAALPALREELSLHPGPREPGGAPSWTLADPVRNRFFRIGWEAFEVLVRWELGDPRAIAEVVGRETTLSPSPEDVVAVARFLSANQLVSPRDAAAREALSRVARAAKPSWAVWLLHHYLFFRVPLIRPDALLARALPWTAWAFSRAFLAATLGALLAGLFLAGRQWDRFVATLLDTATPEGFAAFGAALAGAKLLHEFGHAMAARRQGCRVPAMGVAFMVLWPMLYTDLNEVWKLACREARATIAAAGVLVELALAAWATLAWGLLPDGPARQAAFVLASVTWISSVAINLSPFMRFDGYFLLSDLLDTPNLHERAFAQARWALREALFGLGEAPPEDFAPGRRAFLIAFALFVWVYRLVVFLGIAALVYHFFVKLVGVALFAVEIGWFVLRPVWEELRQWHARRHRLTLGRHTLATLAGLALILALAVLPWQGRVAAPAILKADRHAVLYAPGAGRLEAAPSAGRFEEGAVVFRIETPDLDHALAQARRRITIAEWEFAAAPVDEERRARMMVLAEELAKALAEHDGLARRKDDHRVAAPFAGTLVDPDPDLATGQWVEEGRRLAALRGDGPDAMLAWVAEEDLGRIEPGARAMFHPDRGERAPIPCVVDRIDRAAARVLTEPALASPHGGPIPARPGDAGPIPERALYRLHCRTEIAADSTLTGTARIDAKPVSPAARLWRWTAAVLMREAGM